jgi:Uma2 family endonuclease
MTVVMDHLGHIDADRFFALRDQLPPRAQLIDGEVVVMQSPALKPQVIVGELFVALRSWTRAAPGRGMCGIPVDVLVNERNVYAPDVWWVGADSVPDIEARFIPGVPDIAVEVLSPSTRRYDLVAKRRRYEQEGLPELWFIDPRDLTSTLLLRSERSAGTFDVTVEVKRDEALTSPLLPGFGVTVASLVAV